ncbi:MAG: ribosome small subunit-dependent GTPase A [Treponema sp.]|jgi:ribosome biogenesis GTPase|nr:ribosome small subunit-dependent GTPase A [Treponema sp.]
MKTPVSRKGLVIRGSRNIFTVRLDDEGEGRRCLACRIKGKVLKGMEAYSNPLAPGDRVTVELERDPPGGILRSPGGDSGAPGAGLITGVLERRNLFTRKNQKALGAGRAAEAQILAANVDLILVLTTPASPPFRPRFLDRVLVQADASGIAAAIICNKQDLLDSSADPEGDWLDMEERLEDFKRIGYPVLRVSAKTGEGLSALRDLIRGRCAVLVGQSGVGKSSLVNALRPEAQARVGALNEKYDRGNHTTTLAEIIEIPGTAETLLIDTPGIRRFVPQGLGAEELVLRMREFAPLAGKCSYGLSCTHRTEPGCKILEAAAAGIIHEDRYESFLRMREELEEGRG